MQNNNMEKTMGKNSSTNLMSMLPSLLGGLGIGIKLIQTAQLPGSFLNAGGITSSLNAYSKNMAMGMAGLSMPSIASVAGISSLAGGLSSITSAIAGVDSLTSSLSVAGISLSDVVQNAARAAILTEMYGGAKPSILKAQKASNISVAGIASTAILMDNLGII